MALNDPLGDLIARIRNAQMRNKSKVSTPGSTLRAPSVNALMLRFTCGIDLAATKPSFFDLVAWAATMPEIYSHSSM